jgi:hypothetical protein
MAFVVTGVLNGGDGFDSSTVFATEAHAERTSTPDITTLFTRELGRSAACQQWVIAGRRWVGGWRLFLLGVGHSRDR